MPNSIDAMDLNAVEQRLDTELDPTNRGTWVQKQGTTINNLHYAKIASCNLIATLKNHNETFYQNLISKLESFNGLIEGELMNRPNNNIAYRGLYWLRYGWSRVKRAFQATSGSIERCVNGYENFHDEEEEIEKDLKLLCNSVPTFNTGSEDSDHVIVDIEALAGSSSTSASHDARMQQHTLRRRRQPAMGGGASETGTELHKSTYGYVTNAMGDESPIPDMVDLDLELGLPREDSHTAVDSIYDHKSGDGWKAPHNTPQKIQKAPSILLEEVDEDETKKARTSSPARFESPEPVVSDDMFDDISVNSDVESICLEEQTTSSLDNGNEDLKGGIAASDDQFVSFKSPAGSENVSPMLFLAGASSSKSPTDVVLEQDPFENISVSPGSAMASPLEL